MSTLSQAQLATLTALLDAIYPSVPGISGAVESGVADRLVRELDEPPWNGQRRYTAGPFASPDHPGHGWQSEAAPASALGASLSEIDQWARTQLGQPVAELARDRADRVVEALAAGELVLSQGIHPVDLFQILHRYVFEQMHGEAVYGWLRPAAAAQSTAQQPQRAGAGT
jgi:hypothetical protein